MHTIRDFEVSFERVPIMCDNTSVISVAKNPVFNKKMRHVERRHHFLRDHVEKGDIEMKYIDIERQLTDIFTKPLNFSRFADLQGEIGVCHPYSLV
jgi:cell fate regulator YaaT (PSP1 superfamily)